MCNCKYPSSITTAAALRQQQIRLCSKRDQQHSRRPTLHPELAAAHSCHELGRAPRVRLHASVSETTAARSRRGLVWSGKHRIEVRIWHAHCVRLQVPIGYVAQRLLPRSGSSKSDCVAREISNTVDTRLPRPRSLQLTAVMGSAVHREYGCISIGNNRCA